MPDAIKGHCITLAVISILKDVTITTTSFAREESVATTAFYSQETLHPFHVQRGKPAKNQSCSCDCRLRIPIKKARKRLSDAYWVQMYQAIQFLQGKAGKLERQGQQR